MGFRIVQLIIHNYKLLTTFSFPTFDSMSKHVIGYFCASDSWGGLEMNQWRNALWMMERGHQVVMFVREGTPAEKAARESGLVVSRVRKHRKYYDYIKAKQLKRRIKYHGVTHMIVRDPQDMGLCALTKTLLGNQLHLSYFMEMQLGIDKKDLLHTLRFKKFDLWSCPLPWLAEQVKSRTNYPKERIKVIPSGLDLKKYQNDLTRAEAKTKLDLNTDKKWIGLIGRFDAQKGQVLLLRAFQRVQEKLNNYNVVFLGEKTKGEADDYYEEMQSYIQRNGLKGRVEIRPFRKDVESFYAAIDVFVMATKAETFGMVTIEAMASECKIVGSNAGGTPEILNHGEYGTLFETQNVDSLAQALIQSTQRATINSAKLQEEVQQYDFNNVCEQVEKVLFKSEVPH